MNKTDRPIFVDIDGTLTLAPTKMWGPVIEERLKKVRNLCQQGYQVVLWSGGGTKYAEAFAAKYELPVMAALGKPQVFVDDNPDISPSMDHCWAKDI